MYAVTALIASSIALGCSILAVLLDGVERKLKAAIQSRIGPPITQTLYDLLKLSIKEVKPIHTTTYLLLYYISFVTCAVSSVYLIALYAMIGEQFVLAMSLALFAVSLTALTLIPLLIPNPFSYIGGMREVILALVNESSFIIAIPLYLLTMSLINREISTVVPTITITLTSLIILILSSGYALTGRPPFDIAEAEPELASGMFIELSGPLLATYLFFNLLKRFIVKFLIGTLFITTLLGHGIIVVLVSILAAIILWISFAITGAILGRSRIDIAPLTMAKVYIALYILSITGLLVIIVE